MDEGFHQIYSLKPRTFTKKKTEDLEEKFRTETQIRRRKT